MKPDPQFMAGAPIASPCINICEVDAERGWCKGCFRTLEEIANWAQSSDAAKRAVLERLVTRRRAIQGPGQH